MNLFEQINDFVREQVLAINPKWPTARITVETPKDAAHGEMATNVAMVLAKDAGMNPRALAEQIAERLRSHPQISEVTLAGPGFINMTFAPDFWRKLVPEILNKGRRFGASDEHGTVINVEYVSANPTGPLHAGHVRGAVIGDALCNLLAFAGYYVTREYYLNDYGNQVDILARSVYLRYREALGEKIEIPEGCYPGEYLIPVAKTHFADANGDQWLRVPEKEWLPVFRETSINAMMELIKADLESLGIRHHIITSERKLVEDGKVQAAFDHLQAKGDLYFGTLEPPKGELPDDWEPRDQWLFRATAYGDDVDRPLKKSDGSWTYFASDVANHFDKFQRGAARMVTAVGADHAGYVKRLEAVTRAVTDGKGELKVLVFQMVRLLENGQTLKLSKRAGNLILISDILDRVSKDVVRLMMLTRRHDQPIDFDFAKVTEQSRDNPVFYIQYAHARICSVLRHANEIFGDNESVRLDDGSLAKMDLTHLISQAEIALIRRLAEWPRIVGAAAAAREPHRIAFYLQDVAAELHSLWTAGKDDATLRFILPDQPEKTGARLALLRAAALVIAAGLGIIGVQPVEQM